MIDLLTDNEGQPLSMIGSANCQVWENFNLGKADEYELIMLLRNSVLEKFEEIDERIEKLIDLKVFNEDCLEYLEEIFSGSKRFDRDSSYNLVARDRNVVCIVCISAVDGKLSLLCACRNKGDERGELITKVVNAVLHWLWIFMNSF